MQDERTTFLSKPLEPDLNTVKYWVHRLDPVLSAGSSEETVVVVANRCGVEGDATYAGSSIVMGIKDGLVTVYGVLGRGVEQLLVVDTDQPPFGVLYKRSASSSPESEESMPEGAPQEPQPKSEPRLTDSPTLPSTGPAPSIT